MGHFFSRAIKRFSQCNSGRNQPPSHSQQRQNASTSQQETTTTSQQREPEPRQPTMQAIPVGQSIDSAEYAAFQTAPSSADTTSKEEAAKAEDDQEDSSRQQASAAEPNQLNEKDKPKVEEAVIKIQALVRGHLTRKALKDAHQQAATVAHNALGQSQFDEESLTRNPPSAVFLPSSPLTTNLSNLSGEALNSPGTISGSQMNKSRVPPLESIAEESSNTTNQSSQTTASNREKRKLSPIDRSWTPSPHSSGEATVSIDINCDTPASASIDIVDHSSTKPAFVMASVLHPKESPQPQPQPHPHPQPDNSQQSVAENTNNLVRRVHELPLTLVTNLEEGHIQTTSSLPSSPGHMNLAGVSGTPNSHSIDSAEAAAIRIQSAFRGYHTRKHSPYRRRRSPPTVISGPNESGASDGGALSNNGGGPMTSAQLQRNNLAQQAATIESEDDDQDEGVDGCDVPRGSQVESSRPKVSQGEHSHQEANRQSRQRHRSIEQEAANTTATDTTTDEQTSVKDVNDAQHRESISTAEDTTTTVLSGAAGLTNRTATGQLTTAEPDESEAQQSSAKASPTSHYSREQQHQSVDIDQGRWSAELDTDSSNLGAALSLNEELSEEAQLNTQSNEANLSERLASQSHSLASGGAAVQEEDRSASEARRLVEQLTNEDEDDEFAAEDEPQSKSSRAQAPTSTKSEQELDLDQATSRLEAALEEATDNYEDERNNQERDQGYYGDRLAESLADRILEDEAADEQHTNELESDEIERRDPRAGVSQDCNRAAERKAALVSFSSEERGQEPEPEPSELQQQQQQQQQQQRRLDIVSPDEAIGSGRSSPALVSSTNENSEENSDEEAGAGAVDSDAEQQEEGPGASDGKKGAGNGQQQQPQGALGNKKNRKKRNKNRGKK